MDVFVLREKVVSDYRQYIGSFVRIRDDRIDGFVQEELNKGALWPEAILQLNPAYEPRVAHTSRRSEAVKKSRKSKKLRNFLVLAIQL